jgi:hypothetical protein
MTKKTFTTSRGTAVGFVTLNNPDTKFDKDGKFSVALAFDADDATLQQIEAAAAELTEAKLEEVKAEITEKLTKQNKKGLIAKTLDVLSTINLIKTEEDEETGEETGRKIIKASMKHSGISQKTNKPWKRWPDYFNAQGKQLKNPPAIGSGSELKMNIELVPYYAANDKTVGCTFRLNGVQIIKLVSYGARNASSYGFGAEEDGDEIEDRIEDDTETGGADDTGTDDGEDDEL